MLIINPKELELVINQIPGVVTCGLFAKRPADILLLASQGNILKFARDAKNVDRDYSVALKKLSKIVGTVRCRVFYTVKVELELIFST